MSLPLLASSPTVRLQVGTDRQLRTDALRSSSDSNALKLRTNGLYLKRGRRLYGWNITTPPLTQVGVLTTQLNQVVNFGSEQLDAGSMFDVVASQTRVTFPEAGRWLTQIAIAAQLTGGTSAACMATLAMIRNGTEVACSGNGASLTAANLGASVSITGYVNVAAGDYLEVYWRWLQFATLTATACSFFGVWSGARVSE